MLIKKRHNVQKKGRLSLYLTASLKDCQRQNITPLNYLYLQKKPGLLRQNVTLMKKKQLTNHQGYRNVR